jgi:hypothetical protein
MWIGWGVVLIVSVWTLGYDKTWPDAVSGQVRPKLTSRARWISLCVLHPVPRIAPQRTWAEAQTCSAGRDHVEYQQVSHNHAFLFSSCLFLDPSCCLAASYLPQLELRRPLITRTFIAHISQMTMWVPIHHHATVEPKSVVIVADAGALYSHTLPGCTINQTAGLYTGTVGVSVCVLVARIDPAVWRRQAGGLKWVRTSCVTRQRVSDTRAC